MSARGRGSEPEPNEFYETPRWCVARLLDCIGEKLFNPDLATEPGTRFFLEAAIGGGAIVRAVNAWCEGNAYPQPFWSGCDIREDGLAWAREGGVKVLHVGSFPDLVEASKIARVDVAITNPPFSQSLAFAQAALWIAPVVIQLGRIGWLGSADRADYLRANTPSVYLLPERPSFKGGGRTDSDYYAWFAWGVDDRPRFVILDSTPLDERKAEYETER